VLEAEREPKQRRLSTPVRACDREELARLDLEIRVVQHGRPVRVRELDSFEANR
jgi:hypothetical protein